MTTEELHPLWLNAKAGILEEADLVEVDHVRGSEGQQNWIRYVCPCGGKDHYAMRTWIVEGFSKFKAAVVTCFPSNQQWAIRAIDVAAIIRGEEDAYLTLLSRAEAVCRKVIDNRGWSEDTKAFLHNTHGIDPEISELFAARQKSAAPGLTD